MDRRDPDTESCCEAGVGVAAAQVGQDEQGLPATGQATPPGADPTTVTCEETRQVLQGAAGQIDTGRADKHAKAPGGLVILVVNPSTRSLLHVHRWGRPSNHPSVWKRLIDSSSEEGPAQLMSGAWRYGRGLWLALCY